MRSLELGNPGVVAGLPGVVPQKTCPTSKSLETMLHYLEKASLQISSNILRSSCITPGGPKSNSRCP